MVIQRIQTLFLLLAVALMATFTFVPFLSTGGLSLASTDFPVYLTLNLLTVILLAIDIFLFKNLARQIMVAKVSVMLIVGSIVCGFITAYCGSFPNGTVFNWYSILLLVLTLLSTLLAIRNMQKDRHILKSYDSFR